MTLRCSQLQHDWECLLTDADIAVCLTKGLSSSLLEKLPEGPGIYRWIFPPESSERPRAYVGQAENLQRRVSDYLKAAAEPITTASEDSFSEEGLRKAISRIHGCSVFRVGECLARKAGKTGAELQSLRITEEGMILGVEVSAGLLRDEIGRVFLECGAILSTERDGYTMLNRSPHGRYIDVKSFLKATAGA